MFEWIWRTLKSWIGFERPQFEPARDSAPSRSQDHRRAYAAPAIKQESIGSVRVIGDTSGDEDRPKSEDVVQGIVRQLIRFQTRQSLLQDERLNQLAKGLHRQFESRMDRHAEKVGAHVATQVDALCHQLPVSMSTSLNPLADRIAASVSAMTEASNVVLRKEFSDAVTTNLHQACLRPVIDQLLALHDRIGDERQFLGVSFRRDVDLATCAGARQLHEQHDAAARSFSTEILIILRGLGVEPLEMIGPELDPHLQRVVGVDLPSRDELDGRIARVTRRGFRWIGALLRPEHVIVYKKGD